MYCVVFASASVTISFSQPVAMGNSRRNSTEILIRKFRVAVTKSRVFFTQRDTLDLPLSIPPHTLSLFLFCFLISFCLSVCLLTSASFHFFFRLRSSN